MKTFTSISAAILFTAGSAFLNTTLADDQEVESASDLYASQEQEDADNKIVNTNQANKDEEDC